MDTLDASNGDEEDVHFIEGESEKRQEPEGAVKLHARSHHKADPFRCNNSLTLFSITSFIVAAAVSIAHAPSIMIASKAPASMDQLRFDIATVSIELMQNDTIEEASKSHFVDISPFVDLVDVALDTVGIRGVYIELFESRSFAETVTAAAKAKGLHDFYVEVDHKPDKQPSFTYFGVPNNREFPVDASLCTGCLWWLRHWVGAITADKLLRDGSLRLDNTSSEIRLYDAESVMKELQRIGLPRASTKESQKLHHPDILPIHAMHGFAWHYVTMTRPDMDAYPLDIAQNLCGDFLWEDGYVADLSTGVGNDCRHAFGHALFYVLAMRETGGPDNFSVRKQFRPAGGFVLSDDSMCEGYRICKGAPDENTYKECKGGMRHSYRIVGLQDMSDEAKQAEGKRENRCNERDSTTDDEQ